MSRRHQIQIFTSDRGKTWASCSTCNRSSKQSTKAIAEAWMTQHADETLTAAKHRRTT